MIPNITAYSTALFSTWINIEEYNVLFDAGDGLVSGLLQKSRKIKTVFISHPDRDHLSGLLQFNQLNSRDGYPKIYYPRDSGSFPALSDFQARFDPHVSGSQWIAIEDGTRINIKKNLIVEALRNEHIPCSIGTHKSLSYRILETKRKLKSAFVHMSDDQIKQVVHSYGQDHVTDVLETRIFAYSADTPVDRYEKWDKTDILIHEATFLKPESSAQTERMMSKHSMLEDVIKMVSEIKINTLILSHFSTRYHRDEILEAVLKLCRLYKIKIPVHIIYPGEIHRNILTSAPVNA